jgi:hypothetical protein
MLTILRYGTFLDVYRRNWSDILHFRSRNLFTTCEVCFALKQALQQKDSSLDARLTALKQYRAHLHSQYCDRSVIWKLQAESAEPNSGVLLISTDGLDQSKFALPREPELRNNAALNLASKITLFFWFAFSFSYWLVWYHPFRQISSFACPNIPQLRAKFQRPRVKVHGAWAFGYTFNVFILDEVSKHDSSAIIEILTQTIEDAARLHLYIDFFRVQLAENLDPRLGMF